jgi:hypothetical protein
MNNHKKLKEVIVIDQFTYNIDDEDVIYIEDSITNDIITYDTKAKDMFNERTRFKRFHAIGINSCIIVINSNK